MSEAPTTKHLRMRVAEFGARLFRQNVGLAWVGKIVHKGKTRMTLENPRPFHAGLCTGSSDTIGWWPVKITPDMVGKTVAVFTAVEIKEGNTATTEDQKNFVNAVKRAGGIAEIIHGDRLDSELQEIIEIVERRHFPV